MDSILQLQSDRERRIQERRRRIHERLNALRQGGTAHTAKGEPQDAPVGPGLQQMMESTRRIMALKAETGAMVNSYPLEADVAENWRRNAEAKRKHGLRSRMLEEAEESAKKNAVVAMHWADLFAIDVPQALWDAMEGQKSDCNAIIQSKTDLITHIKKDLKVMDNDFAKLLKQQMDDMSQMLKAMTEQLESMAGACKHELDEVEMAYMNERKGVLEQNKAEMHQMFEKRNKLEQEFLERYLSLVSGYQKSLFDMQVGDAQDFNSLKLNLETDRQKLERHMEAMLATYQLNIEKLDYNYRVLVERDHENSATINQQKRKIARQRDQLTSLKARYQESDQKFHEENMKLTSEYKRMTEQFKDLQLKFKHFEHVDSRKYIEVWKMKEAQIVELAKKVMAADKVIHEQQLGLKWSAPSDEVLISPYSPQAAGAEAKNSEEGHAAANSCADGDGEEADEATLARTMALEEIRKLRQDPRHGFALDCRIKPAMDMISDEAGFLLEPVVRKQIEALPGDEQERVRLDALLEALGISDCAGLEALVEALDPSSDVELRAKGMGTNDKAALKAQPVVVSPDDALRRLRAFVEAENASGIQDGSSKPTIAGPRPGVSRRVLEREREFWRNVPKVVDERGRRVFSSLESNLHKYYVLLQKREKSLRSVENAGKQNLELRALLNQYLSSKINTELQIPPTQLI